MRALNAALALVDNIIKSKSTTSEVNDIQQELLLEMLKLQCDCTLKELTIKTNKLLKTSVPNIAMTADKISLSSIVKGVLDSAIDTVWGLQLKSLRDIGNSLSSPFLVILIMIIYIKGKILCCEDIIANPLTPVVIEYLEIIGTAITELSNHFLDFKDTDSKDDENSTPESSFSSLETVRQNMIGKFLSDVESTKNAKVLSSVSSNTTKAYNAMKVSSLL